MVAGKVPTAFSAPHTRGGYYFNACKIVTNVRIKPPHYKMCARRTRDTSDDDDQRTEVEELS